MEIRQLKEFSEISGVRRSPTTTEHNKFPKWNNNTKKFDYSCISTSDIIDLPDYVEKSAYVDDYLTTVAQTQTGSANSNYWASFTMNNPSNPTKYLKLGRLAWLDSFELPTLPGDMKVLFDQSNSIGGNTAFKYNYTTNKLLFQGTPLLFDTSTPTGTYKEGLKFLGNYSWAIGGGIETSASGSYNIQSGYKAGFNLGASSARNSIYGPYAGEFADPLITDSIFIGAYSGRRETSSGAFFLDIVKYKLAALEFVSRKIGKTGIFKKYFNPEHIKYNNPGYMEFFITYFESYAGHATGQISATALNNAVNIEKKYLAVFNAFGADSLLQHEILRELAILVALKNMYYSQYYDRSAIKGILNEIKEKSKINEHQIIASNLLTVFSKRQKGTSAAYFNLQNQKEQFISLDDFKGKFIYLTFWNSQCIDCESEFELISKVVDKFKDNLEVVSISTDKHFLNMQYFLKNKNYNWNFLHFNGNYELLEQYQIKTVPFYILIDPNGNIAEYPAKEPIYNLDAYFSKIISGKNNE